MAHLCLKTPLVAVSVDNEEFTLLQSNFQMPIGIGIAQLRFPNSATFDLILLLILPDRDEEKE